MFRKFVLPHSQCCKLARKFYFEYISLFGRLQSAKGTEGVFTNNLQALHQNKACQWQNKQKEFSQQQTPQQFSLPTQDQQQQLDQHKIIHRSNYNPQYDQQPSSFNSHTSTVNNCDSVLSTMELAAKARRQIFDLWKTIAFRQADLLSFQQSAFQNHQSNKNERDVSKDTSNKNSAKKQTNLQQKTAQLDNWRVCQVQSILDKYKLSVNTARQSDVSRGLGDAFERLLLLCVPLPLSISSSSSQSSSTINQAVNKQPTSQLEVIMHLAGRNGRQLDVRTIQHLFARTSSFAEALAIFYTLRKCNFAMNMQAYHAMLYSLQRLEQEGWAQRFHDQYASNGKCVLSQQALDFILQGVDNQLLPQNKPWLGRVMYAEGDRVAEKRQAIKQYDELGKMWLARYKN